MYKSIIGTLLVFSLVSLNGLNGQGTASDGLRVISTTTLLGDIVSAIAGDHIQHTVLLPSHADPHGYELKAADMMTLTKADVLFVMGLGLDDFLKPALRKTMDTLRVENLSKNMERRHVPSHGHHHDHEHAHDTEVDPHIWFNPLNVMHWVDAVEQTLSELDPRHTAAYQANASGYRQTLEELDAWIQEQVKNIPPAKRRIVTDHNFLSHFCERYGFTQVGFIHRGISALSAPSAKEVARLEKHLGGAGIPALFVGKNSNPKLARRMALDLNIDIAYLYTESLGNPDGPAGNYPDFMRYNVGIIMNALQNHEGRSH